MSDRSCNYCEDKGDCTRCSYFFEPDKPHSVCGRLWRDHTVHTQADYPPYTTCAQEGESHG